MARSRRIAVAATLVVAAAAAVVLITRGGEDSSPRLDALRADPLGRHVPAGGRLALEDAGAEGETLGKPRSAQYVRWYAITGDARAAFDAAVRVAESAGWRLEVAPGDVPAVVGSKQIDGGTATAVVALRSDPALLPPDVPAPALSINLRR